jgi:hypothetical protein
MKLSAEIETNPGPSAWFGAEIVLERGEVTPGYWGLHFAWWLLPDWRTWLWYREWDASADWSLYSTRLLGFEITWEQRKR